MSSRATALITVLVGSLWAILLFQRVLFDWDQATLYRDLGRDFLTQKAFWANSMRNGDGIPYWNHFALGGAPFLARNAVAPYHPFNFIFLLFAPENYPNAMGFFLALHYVVLYCGGFYLLRVLRIPRNQSYLFAMAFAGSGYLISANSLPHLLASAMSMPFLFAFLILWLRSGKWLHLFGCSAALAWPIYGGDPQFTYVAAVLVAVLLVCCKKLTWQDRINRFAALGVLTTLAASAQLLPTATLATQSLRGYAGLLFDEITLHSIAPLRSLEAFLPGLFGKVFPNQDMFWGEKYVDWPGGAPLLPSLYLGSLVLFSLSLGMLYFGKKILTVRRLLFPLLGGSFFFYLCIGRFQPIPIYKIMIDYLPFWGSFRYPSRLFFWVGFLLCIGAALMLRRILLLHRISNRPRTGVWPLATLGIWAGLLLIVFLCMRSLGQASIYHALGSTGLFLGLLGLLFWVHQRRLITNDLFWPLLMLLTTADIYLANHHLVLVMPKMITQAESYPYVKEIQADLAKRSPELRQGAARRFSRIEIRAMRGKIIAYPFLTNDNPTRTMYLMWDQLYSNIPPYFGIEEATGYYSFLPSETLRFWHELLPKNKPLLYDLFGIYYTPVRKNGKRIEFKVNKSALPYLSSPERTLHFSNDKKLNEYLLSPKFQHHTEVLLEIKNTEAILSEVKTPKFVLDSQSDRNMTGATQSPKTSGGGTPEINITKRNGRTFSTELTFPDASVGRVLLWNESYSKNWRVHVDGRKVSVVRANNWAMAIHLPDAAAGKKIKVEWKYQNPLITLGIGLSFFWYILLLMICFGKVKLWDWKKTQV